MYINTYVLSVPEENKDEYIRIANVFADVAKEYGVLQIFENWETEVPDGEHTDFRKAVKAKPGEKIVVSWMIWPDKKTWDIAHEGMFTDQRILEVGEMPFEGKFMIMGNFEPILSYQKTE